MKIVNAVATIIGVCCITYCLLQVIKWALGPYAILLGL